MSTNLTCIFGF